MTDTCELSIPLKCKGTVTLQYTDKDTHKIVEQGQCTNRVFTQSFLNPSILNGIWAKHILPNSDKTYLYLCNFNGQVNYSMPLAPGDPIGVAFNGSETSGVSQGKERTQERVITTNGTTMYMKRVFDWTAGQIERPITHISWSKQYLSGYQGSLFQAKQYRNVMSGYAFDEQVSVRIYADKYTSSSITINLLDTRTDTGVRNVVLDTPREGFYSNVYYGYIYNFDEHVLEIHFGWYRNPWTKGCFKEVLKVRTDGTIASRDVTQVKDYDALSKSAEYKYFNSLYYRTNNVITHGRMFHIKGMRTSNGHVTSGLIEVDKSTFTTGRTWKQDYTYFSVGRDDMTEGYCYVNGDYLIAAHDMNSHSHIFNLRTNTFDFELANIDGLINARIEKTALGNIVVGEYRDGNNVSDCITSIKQALTLYEVPAGITRPPETGITVIYELEVTF